MDRLNIALGPLDDSPPAENPVEGSLGAANDNVSRHGRNASVVPSPPQVHRIGSKSTSLKNATPYPMHALGPLEDAATAIQDIVQCPDALASHSILGVASLAAQGKRDVEVRSETTVPLSLFVLTVAKSGERKTAADKLAMKSVRAHERTLATQYKHDMRKYNNALAAWEDERQAIRSLIKSPSSRTAAIRDLEQMRAAPDQPLSPTLVVEDATAEGLVKHLANAQASLGFFSDEGGTFIGGYSMTAENRLKTGALFSKFWNGDPVDRHRAIDGSSRFEGRRLSVHLMGQPVAMKPMLADPIMREQGFLGRCLIAWPKSTQGTRNKLKPDPESGLRLATFHKRIGQMLREPLPLLDGTQNELSPPSLKLSVDAAELLTEFQHEVEAELGDGGCYEEISSFANKAPEHAARIAGIMTVYGASDSEEIHIDTIYDAITLVRWYLGEALQLSSEASVSKEQLEKERLRQWVVGEPSGTAQPWGEDFISAQAVSQYGPSSIRNQTVKIRTYLKAFEHEGLLERVDGGATVKGKHCMEAWRIVGSSDS